MEVVITGASSGLGLEIKDALLNAADADNPKGFITGDLTIHNWSMETGVDVRNRDSISVAARKLMERTTQLDVLINCAGVNHIDFIPNLNEEDWDRVMDTNAKGIYLVSKALLPLLGSPSINRDGGTILNIVSNASHVPMTSSLAYNASKGAAKIMTAQMSRELIKTHNITVFSISPNKLKNTDMSRYIDTKVCELRGWSMEEARKYQIASLPAGTETDPETLAEFITFLLSTKERHRYLAGCDIPYGL